MTSRSDGPYMDVHVTRSARRKKTVQARVVDGVLRIAIPAHFSHAQETEWVAKMRIKLERQTQSATIDLVARSDYLSRRFDLPRPSQISWSERQNTRWGSCTPGKGHVRISNQVAAFPGWVIDYVIVHELAHLVEPNHSKAFWALVGRYRRAERARGFLIAKSDEPPS